MMKRLYRRFFTGTETPDELDHHTQQIFTNISDYLDGNGICHSMKDYLTDAEEYARLQKVSPDPIEAYNAIKPLARGAVLPPLFKLAYHILSICPNSASCERLFSVFGNTLTKLRNRLGNDTLSSLAELKMHIRDEHLRNGKVKDRMKRLFGRAQEPQTGTPWAHPVPRQLPTQTTLATNEPEMDIDDATPVEIDPESLSQDGVAGEFNQIIESFGRLARDDEDDGIEEMPSLISITIANLFNFGNRDWIPQHERTASRSLDEELELYELVDLDAQGEEDVDVEMDNSLQSVLHV